ncbi:hypothetical protein [Cupriavidus laharis]|uniref:hypothetical protein n=1 Tax=Cupriavidus laharis TaxID=151654 RepID=UPI001CC4B1A8|nr:hypothetical protein [Cupriavidus laharis]
MKKISISIIILSLSSPVFCQVKTDIYCFRSTASISRDFELRMYYDYGVKWEGGVVKYRGSKIPITLVLKENEIEKLSDYAPYQQTRTWLEVYGGKIAGEYEMMSQGANIYSMTYTSSKNHKKTGFIFDPNISSSPESGCQW